MMNDNDPQRIWEMTPADERRERRDSVIAAVVPLTAVALTFVILLMVARS